MKKEIEEKIISLIIGVIAITIVLGSYYLLIHLINPPDKYICRYGSGFETYQCYRILEKLEDGFIVQVGHETMGNVEEVFLSNDAFLAHSKWQFKTIKDY